MLICPNINIIYVALSELKTLEQIGILYLRMFHLKSKIFFFFKEGGVWSFDKIPGKAQSCLHLQCKQTRYCWRAVQDRL